MTTYEKSWYEKIVHGLDSVKKAITEEELELIEYRRHSSCHIFQDGYEYALKKDGTIKTSKKGKSIQQLELAFRSMLKKHGGDKALDIHLNQKLFPLLNDFYKGAINKH